MTSDNEVGYSFESCVTGLTQYKLRLTAPLDNISEVAEKNSSKLCGREMLVTISRMILTKLARRVSKALSEIAPQLDLLPRTHHGLPASRLSLHRFGPARCGEAPFKTTERNPSRVLLSHPRTAPCGIARKSRRSNNQE
jgi:hypothetical protein